MGWFSKKEEAPKKAAAPQKSGVAKLDLVEQELNKAGLKHQRASLGPLEFIETGFSGEKTTVKIRFIAVGNDGEFKILSDDFAKFPDEKLVEGYALANELNRKYKYVKFAIDNEGDMTAQWDLPDNVPNEAVGATGVEILIRMFQIIDDVYPEVMKAIWS